MHLKKVLRSLYQFLIPDSFRIFVHNILVHIWSIQWNLKYKNTTIEHSLKMIDQTDIIMIAEQDWKLKWREHELFIRQWISNGHRVFYLYFEDSPQNFPRLDLFTPVHITPANSENIIAIFQNLQLEHKIWACMVILTPFLKLNIAQHIHQHLHWPIVLYFEDDLAEITMSKSLEQQISTVLPQCSALVSNIHNSFISSITHKRQLNMYTTSEVVQYYKHIFPLNSIIIVTYNNLSLTKVCLESIIQNTEYPHYEIIVVDNASSDTTPIYLQDFASRHSHTRLILNDDNKGFSAANNQGIELSSGSRIILLNNDTVVPRGWLWKLNYYLSYPDVGLVGPRTNFAKGEARIDVPYKDYPHMYTFAQQVMTKNINMYFEIPVLIMFCVALRKEVFEKIGPLDENFGIGMYEDDDYSERIHRAGLKTICAQDAFVHHEGSKSFKKIPSQEYINLVERNKAYFEQKWGKKAL